MTEPSDGTTVFDKELISLHNLMVKIKIIVERERSEAALLCSTCSSGSWSWEGEGGGGVGLLSVGTWFVLLGSFFIHALNIDNFWTNAYHNIRKSCGLQKLDFINCVRIRSNLNNAFHRAP